MTTRVVTLSILIALVSCSGSGAEAHPTAVPVAAQVPLPSELPWLCDLEGGRYCDPCSGCSQDKSGALCCVGTICVEWTGGSCQGILGWCNNYTLTTDPHTGIEVAECHDG